MTNQKPDINILKLRDLYITLFEEFKNSYQLIFKQLVLYNSKKTFYPAPNQNLNRYHPKSIRGYQIQYSDTNILSHSVWQLIVNLETTKEIFNYLIKNDLSPFKSVAFEEDIRRQPSITKNLIADFIVRISEFSDFGSDLKKEDFDKTFFELKEFLSSDRYKYKVLVNLRGPLGDIEDFSIGFANIKKADYEISKLFCIHYSEPDTVHFNMLENDYYIEIEKEIIKVNWSEHRIEEHKFIDSIFNCLILSSPGNIELGEELYVSTAWPMIKTQKIRYNLPYNKYNEKNLFKYEFNNLSKNIINKNYSKLEFINYEKLDEKIKTSILRLKKSKATLNIEDKIIELVLSIEYLINTANYEVTFQLCLKMIKMFDESNQDETIFKLLKTFFTLRGDVVHGNKKVELTKQNVDLIQHVEKIAQAILLKFIILNQDYSFKEINQALDKSLFLDKSIDEILKNEV